MKRQIPPKGTHQGSGMVITRRRFEKISAVEGLFLTPKLSKAFDMFEVKGWSPEQRRAFIREQFLKKSA